jgi:predicted nucleotidyltransferase
MRWPSREEVDAAMQQWIIARVNECPPIMAIGYFGSYARGDAGVGSDLDVVMIVTESNRPFEQRAIDWDFRSIPVPVELLVYTLVEWQQLPDHQHRFHQTLTQETIWLKRLSG